MAEGRLQAQWNQASHLMAVVHNTFSTEPVTPADMNPLAGPRRMRDEIDLWTDDLTFLNPRG